MMCLLGAPASFQAWLPAPRWHTIPLIIFYHLGGAFWGVTSQDTKFVGTVFLSQLVRGTVVYGFV